MVAEESSENVTIEPITQWLYRLVTPIVNVYAVRRSTGFVLVDTGVAGSEHASLEALGRIEELLTGLVAAGGA